jgi:hypothetical protein
MRWYVHINNPIAMADYFEMAEPEQARLILFENNHDDPSR